MPSRPHEAGQPAWRALLDRGLGEGGGWRVMDGTTKGWRVVGREARQGQVGLACPGVTRMSGEQVC